MNGQGSGRAPGAWPAATPPPKPAGTRGGSTVGVGITGGVAVVGLAAFCAFQTFRLGGPATTRAEPAGMLDRRGGAAATTPATGLRTSPAPLPPSPPAAKPALSPGVLFARAAPAVVRVNVHDGAMKPLGHGSGFFVSADGLVVTNYHVIDGAGDATVERSDGGRLRVQGVAAIDATHDLVLLKVAPADDRPLPTLTIGAGPPPAVGTTVYAIGHPLGLRNVLSEGLVSGLGDPDRGQDFIQTSAAISPGSSGGPLMTADGVVVGVTTATVRGAQNMNFAMTAGRVRRLLGRPRANPPLPLSKASSGRVADAGRQAAGLPDRTPDRTLDHALDRAWEAIRRGRLNEAAELIGQVRGRGKDSAYYWFTCGTVHMRLNNDDLAIDAFGKSLALRPDKAATHLNLGAVYARRRKLREAIAAYEAAAKLDPNDARAYAQAGQAYAHHLQPGRAVPFLERAAGLEPGNAAHHRELGTAYLALAKGESAAACFEEAVRLEPGNGENHRRLGVALLHLRQNARALKALRQAVSLKPDDAQAYLFLGYAHHHAGDRRAAKEAWVNADRFDRHAGVAGIRARQALRRCERGKEPAVPIPG